MSGLNGLHHNVLASDMALGEAIANQAQAGIYGAGIPLGGQAKQMLGANVGLQAQQSAIPAAATPGIAAVQRLDSLLRLACEMTIEVESRLRPVLSNPLPRKEQAKAREPSGIPLVDMLDAASERVQTIVDIQRGILARLAI